MKKYSIVLKDGTVAAEFDSLVFEYFDTAKRIGKLPHVVRDNKQNRILNGYDWDLRTRLEEMYSAR